MKKQLLSLITLISILGYSFTTKLIPKVTVTILATVGFNEYKSQTFITKEMADNYYKPITYTPTLVPALTGYSIGIDGCCNVELPPVDWNRDVQSKPDFMAVCFTADYGQLINVPDLNHLPNYYELTYCDSVFLSRNNIGYGIKRLGTSFIIDTTSSHSIVSKDRLNSALTSKMNSTVTIPTDNNQLANGSGFITGITSTMIISALGFVPISGINITAANNDVTISTSTIGSVVNITITPYVPTTYTVTRAVNNSTFQISSTRRSSVVYNALLTATTNITGSSDAIVLLQYSNNGGSTWLNAPQMENAGIATLAIALNFINKQAGVIVGLDYLPGTIFRLVPTATNATNTFVVGFETF